jgi:hypothetical protein
MASAAAPSSPQVCVRALIGDPGQQASPVMPEGFPAYIAEGLLDHLGWR